MFPITPFKECHPMASAVRKILLNPVSRNLMRRITTLLFLLAASGNLRAAPVRGLSGDLWADRVLGQMNFGELAFNETTSLNLFQGFSVTVDKVHDRLWVFDSGNSRIVGVSNLASAVNAQGADIVLGQPDFFRSACNGSGTYQDYPSQTPPTASTLCGVEQGHLTPAEGGCGANMAVDSQGNLYMPDFFNNRVLRYDYPMVSGQDASHVWGQADFSGYRFNRGGAPSSITVGFRGVMGYDLWSAGVAVDDWGNLWVAETGNHRVMRFPNTSGVAGGVPDSGADVVLGQANFTSRTPASSETDLAHFRTPNSVRVDGQGNVYVGDLPATSAVTGQGFMGRITVFKPTGFSGGIPTYVNGAAADHVICRDASNQPLFRRVAGLEWDTPQASDPTSGGLWVTDGYQLLLLQIDFTPSFSAVAKKTLFKDTPRTANDPSIYCGMTGVVGDLPGFTDAAGRVHPSWYMCDMFAGVGVDASGNVYANGKLQQSVWRFPAPIPTPWVGHARSANLELFKARQFGSFNTKSPDRMYYCTGVAVGAGQFIASDQNRIFFWNMPSGPAALANGQAPDGRTGYTKPSDPLFEGHPETSRMSTDKASPVSHLYVSRGRPAQIVVYELPLTDNKSSMTSWGPSLPVLGGGTVSWNWVDGVAPEPDAAHLWISDRLNSRVLRVRDPLTAPVVDIILGQPSAASTMCNAPSGTPSASNLCNPGAIRLDHAGNLYVSDSALETAGNWRFFRYDAATLVNGGSTPLIGVPASGVYGRNGDFTTGQWGCVNTADPTMKVCGPWEPAFTPDDEYMVAGMNPYLASRFPVIFRNPASGDFPVARMGDFGGQSYSAVFDDDGNLYLGDLTWSRVTVYLDPFADGLPTPTLTFTATVTKTRTPTYTHTGSFTPSFTATITATPTFTETLTITRTPTPTRTPTSTFTPTPTVTATVSETATPTSTMSPTPSSTWTQTFTLSRTHTPTHSSTPTSTHSATSSSTPTSGAGETPQGGFYPHPVKEGDHVHFGASVKKGDRPVLSIYTTSSRRVARHELSSAVAGWTEWDIALTDVKGAPLADGVYFALFEAGGKRAIHKLVIVR